MRPEVEALIAKKQAEQKEREEKELARRKEELAQRKKELAEQCGLYEAEGEKVYWDPVAQPSQGWMYEESETVDGEVRKFRWAKKAPPIQLTDEEYEAILKVLPPEPKDEKKKEEPVQEPQEKEKRFTYELTASPDMQQSKMAMIFKIVAVLTAIGGLILSITLAQEVHYYGDYYRYSETEFNFWKFLGGLMGTAIVTLVTWFQAEVYENIQRIANVLTSMQLNEKEAKD